LYTGILTGSYAPELDLVGVAAAAPATELATLMQDDLGTSGGDNLTAMTLWSWSRVYGAPMSKVITPSALPAVNQLAGMCIERLFDILRRRGPSRTLQQSFLTVNDLAKQEPWRSLLAENTPGPLPSDIPVFLAQGTADHLVIPSVTRQYASILCRSGSRVTLDWLPGVSHGFAGRDSASAAVAWMADRFNDAPAPSNCGSE
jgi:pimeloyl-ACP methyl ester carboxylesterase